MVKRVTPVYEDTAALAKAIREARGTMSQEALASWLGRDKKTIGRWEAGEEGSLGDTLEKRRAIAILVAEATGRRDLLGLSEPAKDRELQELRRAIGALATLLTTPDLDPAARQLLENELAAARQWSTSTPPIEEPGSA